MCIREEASRVCLDLRDLEPGSGIDAVHHDARLEGADQASDGPFQLVVAGRVGEDDPWRTGRAAGGLVDVCCGEGRGLEGTSDVDEGDVLRGC